MNVTSSFNWQLFLLSAHVFGSSLFSYLDHIFSNSLIWIINMSGGSGSESIMINFPLGSHISQKFPVLGKSGCCILVTICVAVVLLIGVGMGMAMRSDSANESLDGKKTWSCLQ